MSEVAERLLRRAAATLASAGVPSPHADAEQLLAHACGLPRGRLAGHVASPAAAAAFDQLVAQRARRVPLQHLTGSVGFRYLDLAVGAGVFVPRPETEVVVGAVLDLARAAAAEPVVVDLCSGSGAIALSVAHELATSAVHAVELDPGALSWLRRNAAARADAGDTPIHVHADDVSDALPELDGRVDVVASNPPYVAPDELAACDPEVREHDPLAALVAGADGLDVIRAVARTAGRLLRPGGWLVVEHSDRQGETAPAVLRSAGFLDVTDHDDLAGRPRYSRGRKP